MRPKHPPQGFTLIELMIVVAIISVIASVAVPSLLSSRVAANEAGAISTLRSLVTAQAQFRTILAVDADQDGAGEYGTFGELSGLTPLNARGVGPASPLDPPIMGPPFEQIDANGRARKSGYLFLIYLPDVAQGGLGELPGGGPDPAIDPDHCEYAWSAYGWPVDPTITGNKTYFVDHRGEILQTSMDLVPYSAAVPPPFGAALSAANMTSVPGINGVAATDGNTWTPLR